MDNKLLQITVDHEYYSGANKQLVLVPDSSTQRFLTRYALVFHRVGSIYTLRYFGANNVADFKKNFKALLTEDRSLNFILTNQNSYFYLFTDLPVNWVGDLNFTSHNVHVDSESKQHLLQLQCEDRLLTETGHIGMVQIYADSLYDRDNEFVEIDFDIHFKARHTRWDYIVFNRAGIKLADAKIQSKAGGVFAKPQVITAENHQPAVLFSSGENTFAIQEQSQLRFSLVNQSKGTPSTSSALIDKVLVSDLPMATPDKMKIEVQDGQLQVCSQIYVYL